MDYKQTCEYLYSQMPMFEKQGSAGYKEGLANTIALDSHFGSPHRSYATIHVGGTNGKGSVSHSLAAILQTCGYRVGLYTSPHLVDFRERIRVNGIPISEEYVVDFVEQEKAFFEPLHPSFFEVTTAMAFKYFRDQNIDIAVIEVGLGGRLDCTNIITPIVSVITNISFDHTQFLGNTLAEIATEKAGIIKNNVPVVIGETTAETKPVFESRAKEQGAPIVFAESEPEVIESELCDEGGMNYRTVSYGSIHGDLGGAYQTKNMNTVLAAVSVLAERGFLSNVRDGRNTDTFRQEINTALGSVAAMTGLMGRWQTVHKSPLVVCDTGHNVAGLEYVCKQLEKQKCNNLLMVFGMVDDKDIRSVIKLLPRNAKYFFTKAETKRAMNEIVVKTLAARDNIHGEAFPTVREAYNAAMEQANADDMIFVGGSSYVVGDFLRTCF